MTTEITKPEGSELQQPETLAIERRPATAATADEARTIAVADLLTAAYAQASTLKLTEAESKALRAPFTDDKVRGGAKGDARILYISHIHVSDRLNDVLGLGQWALVKRSQRAEQTKTAEGKPLTRIYFEGVMLIRGAFVTEAVGVGQYHPNNPKEDYGTGLESAMSDCMTRCCKRLGIGSQVWDKGYCDGWLATQGGTRKPVGMPRATATGQEPDTKPETKSPPPPESTDPFDGYVRADCIGEIVKLMELAKASRIEKALRGVGSKLENGEEWKDLPDDKLVTLKSLLA